MVFVFRMSHKDVLCHCVVLGSVEVGNCFCQYDIQSFFKKRDFCLFEYL
jgi:hypothetical protein